MADVEKTTQMLFSLNDLAEKFETLPNDELEVLTTIKLNVEISIQRQRDDDNALSSFDVILHFSTDKGEAKDDAYEYWATLSGSKKELTLADVATAFSIKPDAPIWEMIDE